MSKFKRTKECKIFRYYQKKGYGIFVDVEAHRSKVKVYMGSISETIDRGTIPPIIIMGEVTSNLLGYLEDRNEIVLKTIENIYNEFLNEYEGVYLTGDISAVENWCGRIDVDDVSELKAVRYRYKKFQVEFMTVLNPQKEDHTITYVYILDEKLDYKVLCDFFDYELPEDRYEEILESNIKNYMAYYHCEVAGMTYKVMGHREKETFCEGKASEGDSTIVGKTLGELVRESDETIQELPFC